MRQQIVVVYYCKNSNNQIPRREVDLGFLCSGGRLEESDWSLTAAVTVTRPEQQDARKLQDRSVGRLVVDYFLGVFLPHCSLQNLNTLYVTLLQCCHSCWWVCWWWEKLRVATVPASTTPPTRSAARPHRPSGESRPATPPATPSVAGYLSTSTVSVTTATPSTETQTSTSCAGRVLLLSWY